MFKRASQRSQDEFWSTVPMSPDEKRVNYAHLLLAFESGDRKGTAFLTDRRFVWVSPAGTAILDFDLDDCGGCAIPEEGRPGQPGFIIAFPPTPGAEAEPLFMYPQMPRSRANVILARQFFQSLITELERVHPDW